jgi:hypothetical protein
MNTKKQRQRRRQIVRELSQLSRDGWRDAKPCDYEPLERELRMLGGIPPYEGWRGFPDEDHE